MLHITDFTVYADLHARLAIVVAGLFRSDPACLASDQWRVCIHDRRGKVQDAADWDGVLEGGRIERDEGWSDVCEGCCAAEGELEGLFEEEATENPVGKGSAGITWWR